MLKNRLFPLFFLSFFIIILSSSVALAQLDEWLMTGYPSIEFSDSDYQTFTISHIPEVTTAEDTYFIPLVADNYPVSADWDISLRTFQFPLGNVKVQVSVRTISEDGSDLSDWQFVGEFIPIHSFSSYGQNVLSIPVGIRTDPGRPFLRMIKVVVAHGDFGGSIPPTDLRLDKISLLGASALPTATPSPTASPTATPSPTITPTPDLTDPQCVMGIPFENYETFSFGVGSGCPGPYSSWSFDVPSGWVPNYAVNFNNIDSGGVAYRQCDSGLGADIFLRANSGNLDGWQVRINGSNISGYTSNEWFSLAPWSGFVPVDNANSSSTVDICRPGGEPPPIDLCQRHNFVTSDLGFSADTGSYIPSSGFEASGGTLSITGQVTTTVELNSAHLQFASNTSGSVEILDGATLLGSGDFVGASGFDVALTVPLTSTFVTINITGGDPVDFLLSDIDFCPDVLPTPTPSPSPSATVTGTPPTATATPSATSTPGTPTATFTPVPPPGGTLPPSGGTPGSPPVAPTPSFSFTPVPFPTPFGEAVSPCPVVASSTFLFANLGCPSFSYPSWPGFTIQIWVYFSYLVQMIQALYGSAVCFFSSLWNWIIFPINFLMVAVFSTGYFFCMVAQLFTYMGIFLGRVWGLIGSFFSFTSTPLTPDTTFLGYDLTPFFSMVGVFLSNPYISVIFTVICAVVSFSMWRSIVSNLSGGDADE